MDRTLIEEARSRAESLLLGNVGDLGIMGSRHAYRQVWARDSMIAGLGLALCQAATGGAVHRRSLETLRQFQSSLGKIPHNVGYSNVEDPALVALGGRLRAEDNGAQIVADTTHAGCVDSNLWYIIGHYYAYMTGGDVDLLRRAWPSLEQALLWLRYQDSNECGLLEVHEAMDWADLLSPHYNVLFDNVLYCAAWQCMGQLAGALALPAEAYFQAAREVRDRINILLWVGPEAPVDWDWIRRHRQEWLYSVQRVQTELVVRPFYLPYMGFREYADRFDTLGNLLAILLGVASSRQAHLILDYIRDCGLNEPHPVRALYPEIRPGEREWREYFRVRNLNQPYHYHNGGAWPFLGGFYVAALVQAGRLAEARAELGKLAAMNRLGRDSEWEFNEWFHGLSGRPMGFAGQSWSAAMYIFAHDAVERGAPNVFNSEHGWACRA